MWSGTYAICKRVVDKSACALRENCRVHKFRHTHIPACIKAMLRKTFIYYYTNCITLMQDAPYGPDCVVEAKRRLHVSVTVGVL